jgi:ribosomal protein L7Ae-like RNA K-turn-binding protein
MFNTSTASRVRQVKRGVKEVVKGIRKGEKGSVVILLLQTLG